MRKSEGSILQSFACAPRWPRQRQSKAAGRSNEVAMKFDAVVLEAIYQMARKRGYNRDRKAFLALGQKVVGGMYRKGEI